MNTPNPNIIFIGADHRGLVLKEALQPWLESQGYTVKDIGAHETEKSDDYPDIGFKVAQAVGESPADRVGIVICGSGVGMAVVANKVAGVRASVLHDVELARAARRDDDINVLALGADFITDPAAKAVVEAWLATPFSGEERHSRRLEKISRYERADD